MRISTGIYSRASAAAHPYKSRERGRLWQKELHHVGHVVSSDYLKYAFNVLAVCFFEIIFFKNPNSCISFLYMTHQR